MLDKTKRYLVVGLGLLGGKYALELTRAGFHVDGINRSEGHLQYALEHGYIAGVIGRFVFATISGVVFFAAYAPEGMSPLAYSAGYQASYLVPEAIITLIIICIPPVSHALAEVRKRAVEA